MNKSMVEYLIYFIFYWLSKIFFSILGFKYILYIRSSPDIGFFKRWIFFIPILYLIIKSYNLKFPMIKYYNTFKDLTFKEKIKFVQIGGTDE